jgi:carboxypeptidase Q
MMRCSLLIASSLAVFLVGDSGRAQPASDPISAETREAIEHLTGNIVARGAALSMLEDLTESIGARLTGTEAYGRAARWAADRFRAFGIERVRLEPFTIAHGWQRGGGEGRMVTPVERRLHIESYGWAPPTPDGGLRAPVAFLTDTSAEGIRRDADRLKGKIVLVDRKVLLPASLASPYAAQLDYRALPARLESVGALSVLLYAAQSNNVLRTSAPSSGGELLPLPFGAIGREDALMVKRYAAKGPVRIEYAYRNRISGPIQVDNVVAEIRGREKPEEWVLIGAHLDSWDFATGAQDNGSGVAMVLETARAISALPRPPRRSMRFALWGSEEQNLNGSRAYVASHRDELDRCVAVLNTDSGAGHPRGWETQGRRDVEQALEPLSRAVLAPLGGGEISRNFELGSDHASFGLEGVPTLSLLVDVSGYEDIHHKAADTLDKVDPHGLAAGASLVAVTGYLLAEMADRVGPRLDPTAVREIAKEAGAEEYLAATGLLK